MDIIQRKQPEYSKTEIISKEEPEKKSFLTTIAVFLKNFLTKKRIFRGILVVIFLILGGLTYYFYNQVVELKKNQAQTTPSGQADVKELLQRVSRLIVLPENEEPTVATVSDPEKLKDQPFFAKAKTGDKVLIYSKAKKAILYDPKADKIIEVAPLNIGNGQSSSF